MEIAGADVWGWLGLLGFMLLPAAAVVVVLLYVESWIRAAFQGPEKSEYNKDKPWLSRHLIVAYVIAYVIVLSVLYAVYVDRICKGAGGGEFCM